MKLRAVHIHNFRSIIDANIDAVNYMLLVGANNAGKSTVINALRSFYDDAKWTSDDFPKQGALDSESWVQLSFSLDNEEWESLADEYKEGVETQCLTVRRYFKSDDRSRCQKDQSNIYGFINGTMSDSLFYGAKNVGTAKVGQILYVPALSTPAEQTKMSGPSPLRNMLNYLLKKVVSKSDAFKSVTSAFERLNIEARGNDGFLNEIVRPLNTAISTWNISIDLSVNPVSPEDISKSLVKLSFIDLSLEDSGFDLERYGHGFQRSVIYELIRLAPTFKDEKKSDKKEFNPSFNLVLFEEPEAFLHPSQQESMAYHLRRLGAEEGQQVIITTHSPIFVGKAVEEIDQVVRVQRIDGVTRTFQLNAKDIQKVLTQGGDLLRAMQEFVDRTDVPDNQKGEARRLISSPPSDDIALQEERFRFQLWLDGERSSLFFADKVLLVEGATERGLFNYLLANEWHDLHKLHICVVDVLGKYNVHRYMALLEAFGIPHGIILDRDNELTHHSAVNNLVCSLKNKYTVSTPVYFDKCLEDFLGLPKPRDHKKPIEMLKAITNKSIDGSKMVALRGKFCEALAITTEGTV